MFERLRKGAELGCKGEGRWQEKATAHTCGKRVADSLPIGEDKSIDNESEAKGDLK